MIEGGNNKKQKPAYGADVLRLWVSSVDYTGDVCVGDKVIKQVRSEGGLWRGTPGGGAQTDEDDDGITGWRLAFVPARIWRVCSDPIADGRTIHSL